MTKEADSPRDGIADAQSANSESAGNQQGSSQSDAVTKAEFVRLQEQIETLRRSMQSDKDKAVKRIGEKVSGLETDLQTLLRSAAKDGKSAGDVLEELRQAEEAEAREAMLELARTFKSGQFPKQSSQGNEESKGVNASDVVRDLEMDVEDVAVRAFMTKTFTNEKEAYREAAKLQKSLLRQPTDADAPSRESRRSAPASNQAELQREYETGSKGLYGNQLIKFKQRMREKGLDIH